MVCIVGGVHTCGGHGGGEFMAWRPNGTVVKKLDVWKDSGAINGIRVVFTDDSSEEFGRRDGENKSITFQPGEKVTDFVLWGNGNGTRCGRIQITTDRQSFDWGKDTTGQSSYPSPVHSGILIGIKGRSGWQIDSFGGMFHLAVESVTICNVDFPNFNRGSRDGLVPEVVVSQTYHWGGRPYNWHFSGSRSRTDTWSFTNSTAHNFGVSVTVKAEVPFVTSVEGSAHWNMTTLSSETTSHSIQHTLEWNVSDRINCAADAVVCEAICSKGTLNIPYKSKTLVKLTNGESYWYYTTGMFRNISHSHVDVRVRKLH